MHIRSRQRAKRPGMIAPLTALMSVVLLGILAFSIDISYIVLTQQELQNAADAGALAAARSLQEGYLQYNMTSQSSTISTYTDRSTAEAQRVVQANYAGAAPLVFTAESDIEYGFTNPATGGYSTSTGNFPNTVKVSTRRDAASRSSLALFFAPVFGMRAIDLMAKAGATLRAGIIEPAAVVIPGLNGADNAGILPLAYNVEWWDDFLKTGQDPNGSPAAVDANGKAYLKAFGGGGAKKQLGQANWGWLSLDNSHTGASDLTNWVNNGVTAGDLESLRSSGVFPLALHDSGQLPTSNDGPSGSWNWIGDNGSKPDVAHVINDYVGKTFLIPLYKPIPQDATTLPAFVNPGDAGIGVSNRFFFNIVRFVPIKIVNGTDNNSVAIAASSAFPPQSQFTNTSTADTSTRGTTAVIFVPAKLTQ